MTIEMKHKDTNDIISVDLGTDNSLARKAINEKELLGYRVVNAALMMDALRRLDKIKIGEVVPDDEDPYPLPPK